MKPTQPLTNYQLDRLIKTYHSLCTCGIGKQRADTLAKNRQLLRALRELSDLRKEADVKDVSFKGIHLLPLVERAKKFSIEVHNRTGCEYEGRPYEVHLRAVVAAAEEFILPLGLEEDEKETVIAACWLHDTIEDCRITYNDICGIFSERVADLVYSVTNELGKNRKERAEKTYPKIKSSLLSSFIKGCDRLANMRASNDGNKSHSRRMAKVYLSEHQHFLDSLPYIKTHCMDLYEALEKQAVVLKEI